MKIRKIHKLSVIAMLLALVLYRPAAAHTGGFTYEAPVNNYFVDIGASKLQFVPNDLALFEFNIYPNTDPNNLADFDNVYVTIGDEAAVLLSTFVHRPEGMLTVLSYSFPKAGKYQISARFQKGPNKLAEVSFPVEVGDIAGNAAENWVKIGVIGLFVAVVIITSLVRLRSRQSLQVDK
jgi:hypothetical protein